MSETVKLIIEIPKEQKRMVDMMLDIPPQVENDLISAIRHGIPLDDVKAEIMNEVEEYKKYWDMDEARALEKALDILNNIGKGTKDE